ncbi:hypothetical protein [Endozoicomonas sp. 8E]|uniref:hypothetical protein n=1 Tax=Endozoicomonas sp. 8E TaxID=3035692 RepID=UPI002938E059|nr:hypothetical protein [Endozoicomonas sp. 8E]WOG28152.1 hypothetical protein P6910_00430 [Endozoicomonas sp. 8E]
MYYLVEHNRTTKATQCDEYSDYSLAQEACLQKEQHYFLNNKSEIEVVIFEANTIVDLKRTHSRYFVHDAQKDNTTDALSAVGLVSLSISLLNKKRASQV